MTDRDDASAPTPTPRPAAPRRRGPTGAQLALVAKGAGLAIALVALAMGVVEACRRLGPGDQTDLDQVMLLDDGRHLAVLYRTTTFARSSATTYQLATYDLERGERHTVELWQSEAAGGYKLFPRAGDRAWGLRPDGQLELIDLATPSKQIAGDRLREAVPALAGGYRVTAVIVTPYDAPKAAIRVALPDGSTRYVDMSPALLDAAPPEPPPRPGQVCGDAPASVKLLETDCAFELDGAALQMDDASAQLSLVGRDGVIRWSVPRSELTDRRAAAPVGAALVDGEILLLLSEEKHTLDLVRLSTGGAVLETRRLL